MAVSTPTLLAKATSDQNQPSRTTAAVAPAIGGCFLLAAYGREATAGAPAPNLALSASQGTWSFAEYTVSDAKTNRHTLSLWVDETPSYTANPAFTITPDENCNRWGWLLFEVLGTTVTVVQSKTGLGTTATPNLTLDSPPSADNIVIGIIAAIQPGGGITPGTGFTEIDDTATANLTALQAQWRTGSTSQTVAWANAGTNGSLMIAVEIEAAAVASSRKVRLKVFNTAGSTMTAEVDVGPVPASGMMIAGLATVDIAGEYHLVLSNGTGAAGPITGTLRTQTGDLALLNSYASDAVINQSLIARLHRAFTFETAVPVLGRTPIMQRMSELLRPQVVAEYATEISGLAASSVDLSPAVVDPTLTGWFVSAATAQDDGCVVAPPGPNAKSISVTPVGAAGTTRVQVTVTNGFGFWPASSSFVVVMTKVADDTAVGSWPWMTYPLPAGLPVVEVTSRAALDSEIASANAGTGKVIRVTGNITGGALTVTKVMTRAKPLIIEAAAKLGATLNFSVTLSGAAFVVLRNLDIPNFVTFTNAAKFCSALHVRARWDGGWTHGRAIYFANSALFCYIYACEVSVTPYPAGQRPSDNIRRNVIFWDGNGWNGQPKWCMASHCFVPDPPGRPDPNVYSSGSCCAVIMGDDVSISQIPTNNICHRVLVARAKGGAGQIETKMSKVWIVESGLIDSPATGSVGASNVNNRQGHGSEFLRCFVHRSGGFEVHRGWNRLVAPSVRNGGAIRVCAGTDVGDYYNFELVGKGNTFGAGDQNRIIRPVGNVIDGENYGTGPVATRPRPARATQIEGAATVTIDHAIETNQNYVSGDNTPPAVELTPAQVGLNAPEADDLSGLPSEIWKFSAWIDLTKNWQVYKTTGNTSSVVQTDTGFEVKGGPNTTAEGNIYVFSRYTVPYDNIQLDFDFTRTDGGGGTGAGEAFLVHFCARGKGTALTPTDLSTLDYAAFRAIENEMFGYRLSFGQTSGAGNDNQMRLRIFRADNTAGEQIISTSPNVYPFPQGIPHRIHMFRRGTYVRIVVTRLDNRVVQSVEATDARLAELTGGGHIGVRCMAGRTGRFESFKITRF